jgi:hypothetical protein
MLTSIDSCLVYVKDTMILFSMVVQSCFFLIIIFLNFKLILLVFISFFNILILKINFKKLKKNHFNPFLY